MDVGEVAPASAGDPDLLCGLAGMVDHDYAPAALSCLYRAHQPRRTRSDNENICMD
jgi:hypothetical protein